MLREARRRARRFAAVIIGRRGRSRRRRELLELGGSPPTWMSTKIPAVEKRRHACQFVIRPLVCSRSPASRPSNPWRWRSARGAAADEQHEADDAADGDPCEPPAPVLRFRRLVTAGASVAGHRVVVESSTGGCSSSGLSVRPSGARSRSPVQVGSSSACRRRHSDDRKYVAGRQAGNLPAGGSVLLAHLAEVASCLTSSIAALLEHTEKPKLALLVEDGESSVGSESIAARRTAICAHTPSETTPASTDAASNAAAKRWRPRSPRRSGARRGASAGSSTIPAASSSPSCSSSSSSAP